MALTEDGSFISGMGGDFRDVNNDGYPDIAFVALANQTFPLFLNTGKGEFREATSESGLRALTIKKSGFGAALYDFDNDGWKDLFVSGGDVQYHVLGGHDVNEYNAVYRNLGVSGKWAALEEAAGLTAGPAARHRGCAFGDLDSDGKIDVVVTAIAKDAEVWMNRSPGIYSLARYRASGNEEQSRRHRRPHQAGIEIRHAIQPHDNQCRVRVIKRRTCSLRAWSRHDSRLSRDCMAFRKGSAIDERGGGPRGEGEGAVVAMLIGNAGVRRVDPERGCQSDQVILLLYKDAAQALGDSKFVQFIGLFDAAPILPNGFLLVRQIELQHLFCVL